MSKKPVLDKIQNPDVPGLENEVSLPPIPSKLENDNYYQAHVISPTIQQPTAFYIPSPVPLPPPPPQISNEVCWWSSNDMDAETYSQWYENAYKAALIAPREQEKFKKAKFLKKKDEVVDPQADAERVASAQKELCELMKPLKCNLCNAVMNSPLQAKLHYQGKPHQKKVSMFLNQNAKKPNKMDDSQISSTTSNSDWNTYCDLCKIWFTSQTDATQHYAGKKHMKAAYGATHLKPTKKIKNAAQQNNFGLSFQHEFSMQAAQLVSPVMASVLPPSQLIPPVITPIPSSPIHPSTIISPIAQYSISVLPNTSALLSCDLCGISTNRPDQLEMHKRGAKHIKMLKLNSPGVSVNSISSLPAAIDYSIHRTPSGQYYCATCNITLNSEMSFGQHIESKKHKNQVIAKLETQEIAQSKKLKKK